MLWSGIFVALTTHAPTAAAHGLPPDRALLHIYGSMATLTVTPPIAALPEVDRDGNGTLSADEAHRGCEALKPILGANLKVSADRGMPALLSCSVLSTHHHHGDVGEPTSMTIVLQFRWSAPPQSVELTYDLFSGEEQPVLLIAVEEALDDRRQFGTNTQRRQQIWLTAAQPETTLQLGEPSP